MRRPRAPIAPALLAAALALAPAARALADPGSAGAPDPRAARLAEFRSALAPYGEWLQVAGAGPAWRPSGVEPEWRPYLHGSWTWTEDGWFWVTDEPWGWATYHYGRWLFDDESGWVWLPGTTWAPAWVAWRWCDEAVGWAPLPPRGEPLAAFWTFVPAARFVGSRADEAALPGSRVPALLVRTRRRAGHPERQERAERAERRAGAVASGRPPAGDGG
jgi:hypothetical protein